MARTIIYWWLSIQWFGRRPLGTVAFSIKPMRLSLPYQGNQGRLWCASTRTVTSQFAALVQGTRQDINAPRGTVVDLQNPTTGQLVTLIGTAHLSQQSNDQVTSIIETVKPDVVMVELDPSRLERIGLTIDDLGDNFCSVEDIEPPSWKDDAVASQNRPWFSAISNFLVDMIANFARQMLSSMYEKAGKNIGNGELIGGGEFLAAIKSSQRNDGRFGTRTKIVLGDRNSVVTIKRAIELAIRGGNPIGVALRLASINQEELDELEQKIRKELQEKGEDTNLLNEAIIERIKSDSIFRQIMFERLEREVPEFTRAFITDRDYIMAQAIRREQDARYIVGVVGLAHLPGISLLLQDSQFEEISAD